MLPRTAGARSVADLADDLESRGLDISKVAARVLGEADKRERGRKRTRDTDDNGKPREFSMDMGEDGGAAAAGGSGGMLLGEDGKGAAAARARSSSKGRATSKARSGSKAPRAQTPADVGLRDVRQRTEATKDTRLAQKPRVTKGGEGDRHVFDFKPKHLFSGKRKGQHTASHR